MPLPCLAAVLSLVLVGHLIAGEYSPVRLFLLRVFARWIEVPLLHLTFLACRGRLRFLTRFPPTRLLLAWAVAYPMGHWGDTGRPVPKDKLVEMVEGLEGDIAVGPCRCRVGHKACDHLMESDIVIKTGTRVWMEAFPEEYRLISKREAVDIIEQCSRQGMFHMVFLHCMLGGMVNEYVICNCCTDGCVPYIANRTFGQMYFSLVKGDFRATVERGSCIACGNCVEVCPFDARMLKGDEPLVLDCFGCGLCLPSCRGGATRMTKTS